MSDLVKGKVIRSERGMGKSRVLVECACDNRQWAYLWSWAGHGFFYCGVCKKKVGYRETLGKAT